MNIDSRILKTSYAFAITTFFIFFLFQTLFYFQASQQIITAVCGTLSIGFTIFSLFHASGTTSISLMLSSLLMMIYITEIYWGALTGAYKFLISCAILTILLYSLYKHIKKING